MVQPFMIIASIMLQSAIVSHANVITELSLMKDLRLDEREIFELKNSLLIPNIEDTIISDNKKPRYKHLRHNYNEHSQHHYQPQDSKINHMGDNLYDHWKMRNSKDERDYIKTTTMSSYRVMSIKNWGDKDTNVDHFHGTKRKLHQQSDANTSLGWVPSSYPDPLESPNLCHIPDYFWQSAVGTSSGDPYTSNQGVNKLLLCDPDNIMSYEELNDIGNAIISFNLLYAQGSELCNHQKESYNVGVAQEWKPESQGPDSENKIKGLISISNFERNIYVSNRIEIGVALAKKLDIDAILNEFRLYTFEDEESMTDDAAQFFASILHSQWFNDDRSNIGGIEEQTDACNTQRSSGILIFLSVEDRVCFISSGNSISYILPWWRLERVVANMKEQLRTQQYKDAIIGAIADITHLIDEGPPTFTEKLSDFSARFGLVLLFSLCTFILAVYSELRERRRRFEYAEISTCLNESEKEKARMLQHSYNSSCCPICLEEFGDGDKNSNKDRDSLGIPLKGNDGNPLKMLRCGHIFCLSCWRAWVHSGNANPNCCPVCRQDVSRSAAIEAEISANQISDSQGGEDTTGIPTRNYGAVDSRFNEVIYQNDTSIL